MPDSTPTYGLPFYITATDPPDLGTATEDLALAVEDQIARLDAAIAKLNGLQTVIGANANTEGPYSGIAFTAGTEVCAVPFTAPDSGSVVIWLKAYFQSAINDKAAIISTEVRTGSTIGGGVVLSGVGANSNDALVISGSVTSGVELKLNSATPRLITGLAPGSAYHVRAMHQTESGGNITIFNRQLIVVPQL